MIIKPLRTHKIVPFRESIEEIIARYVTVLKESSILTITSKIVSICENRVVKIGTENKTDLIKREAEFLLPPSKSKYSMTLTIKRGLLVPTAGIDESNANGYYILWPKNPEKSANKIRLFLRKKFGVKKVGVIITDSRTSPLRWGTTGVGLAYSGFDPLKNYIGKPDIFGRPMLVTKANVLDGLAAAAVLNMGEGRECTPLAIIEDLSFIKFRVKNPAKKELGKLRIEIEDDIYAPILTKAEWKKGGA